MNEAGAAAAAPAVAPPVEEGGAAAAASPLLLLDAIRRSEPLAFSQGILGDNPETINSGMRTGTMLCTAPLTRVRRWRWCSS
jgi:hypothetical protein